MPDFGGFDEDLKHAPRGGGFDALALWSGHQAARPVGSGVATNIEWDDEFIDACVSRDAQFVPESCDFGMEATGER